MVIDITLPCDLFFVSFPQTLRINRVRFDLETASPSRLRFTGPDQDSIVVLSFSAQENAAASIPRDLLVCGRRYTKRCENFYTPVDATPREVEQFFDYISAEYEQTIDVRLNRIVARRMLAAARQFASRHQRQEAHVLDFGCGTGLAWDELQRMRRRNGTDPTLFLSGCDLAIGMIERSKLKGFSNVRKCGYAETDFPDHCFDVIFCSFVVHYFPDERPFDEMRRILQPQGLIIFNLPRQSPDQRAYYESILRKCFTPAKAMTIVDWTIDTRQVRLLPVIRYKPAQQSKRKRSPHPRQPSSQNLALTI